MTWTTYFKFKLDFDTIESQKETEREEHMVQQDPCPFYTMPSIKCSSTWRYVILACKLRSVLERRGLIKVDISAPLSSGCHFAVKHNYFNTKSVATRWQLFYFSFIKKNSSLILMNLKASTRPVNNKPFVEKIKVCIFFSCWKYQPYQIAFKSNSLDPLFVSAYVTMWYIKLFNDQSQVCMRLTLRHDVFNFFNFRRKFYLAKAFYGHYIVI